jgi:HlyD family secretion protein
MSDSTTTTGVSGGTKRPALVRVVGLLLLTIAVALLWWRFGPMATRNKNPGTILATGRIEATEVDISAEVAGKLDKLPVEEGDRVEKGRLVAKIEDSQFRAEVARAEAALQAARATLADLEAGARPQELDRARAQVALTKATLELAQADWHRIEQLFEEKVISKNQLDNARTNVDIAESRYKAALEELRLLEAGFRPDQIQAARWQVKQAQAALDLAQVRLEKTDIFSPITGIVLVKDSEAGEVISPGVPILTVADPQDMWVKIYINEADLGKIKLGQAAKVRVDSFPERDFAGTITYISDEAEFTPKNIQTLEDRVKLVFAVKVGIDNLGGLLKPGMYADIELEEMGSNL